MRIQKSPFLQQNSKIQHQTSFIVNYGKTVYSIIPKFRNPAILLVNMTNFVIVLLYSEQIEGINYGKYIVYKFSIWFPICYTRPEKN